MAIDYKDLPNAFASDPKDWRSSIKTAWENWKLARLASQGQYYTSLIPAGVTFATWVGNIGSTSATIWVNSTVAVTANQTIPSNISIHVLKGGSFAISTGVTLTINGPFDADICQIVKTGLGTLAIGNKTRTRSPVWYGAVGDDVEDDATALQMCFDDLRDYCSLVWPAPTIAYRTTAVLEIANKQGVRIEFAPGADTAQGGYAYSIHYDGTMLVGRENPVIRILGCVRSNFTGLAVDADSKADYGLWFAGMNYYDVGAVTVDSVADVDAGTDEITEGGGHPFSTGDLFTYANGGGTSIGGLTTATDYYAIRTSATLFKVATTYANAIAGTAINISDGVGASHTFTWKGKTRTTTYRRSIGCTITSYASTNCNISGGMVGHTSAVNSSQTDITTFHNCYFAVSESATQIALDTIPTTFGAHLVGTNTYVDFDHCQFTGDYGVRADGGSYYFKRPYLLGHAGIYSNGTTTDITLIQPYGEGFKGRPVWVNSADNTEAKNINILGAKFFPSSKATATIDSVNDVDAGTNIITETGHPYVTGDILIYDNGGGTDIAGLTDGQKVWTIRSSANGFQVASSLANAQAGTAIDIADGVGASHTFTWRPCPMRFQSNQNITMTGCFAEDWITDNLGSTGQKPIYIDSGNTWLHPTDHSGNPDLRLSRRSTFAGAAQTDSLIYDHNVRRQVVAETAGPASGGIGWSGVDIVAVNSASGNTWTPPAAYKGMNSIRVWKLGSGTLIVNDATSGGALIRHDSGAAASTDVRVYSLLEQGYIQLDCVDDGYWRVSSNMAISYDSDRRVDTTDATVTTLKTFTLPSSGTYYIEAVVLARRTGGSAGTAEDGASYKMSATYKNVGGTATLIGAEAITANEDQAGWDCAFGPTGATVRIRVTGAVNNNIAWYLADVKTLAISS